MSDSFYVGFIYTSLIWLTASIVLTLVLCLIFRRLNPNDNNNLKDKDNDNLSNKQ